jgi:phytoene dehydrogenase-like protein
MGSIAEAMAGAARKAGAELHTSTPVRRVIVENRSVKGVELADGSRVSASVVVSNADPVATLLGLVDQSALRGRERWQLKGIDMRGSMALVHLLTNRLPMYLGLSEGEGPQHRGFTLLGAALAEFDRCWRAQQRGDLVEGYPLEVTIQSATDPTLAPPGHHTVTVGVQQLPYRLRHGGWDSRREEFIDRVIESFERFAPGIASSIRGSVAITPLDLSREYGLTDGNIFHGAMTLPQLFASRPVAGWSGYATPILGLYLCGAGTHPGGAVMGAAGHNAAQEILGRAESSGHDRRGGLTSKDVLLGSDRLVAWRYAVARSRLLRPLVERIGRR